MTSVAILSPVVTLCGAMASPQAIARSHVPLCFSQGSPCYFTAHYLSSYFLSLCRVAPHAVSFTRLRRIIGTTLFPSPVAITARGKSINVQFDATEDETRFTDAGLAPYDLLIFLMNTGEGSALLLAQWLSSSSSPPEADTGAVLDATGKAALQRYFDLGGNFVAIHSASDCLRNTTFYGREVGESRRVLLPIPAQCPGTDQRPRRSFLRLSSCVTKCGVFDPFVAARLCNEQSLHMRDRGRGQCVASEYKHAPC
jgi:hypothetical protein